MSPPPSLNVSTVCIDCADAQEMADFYCALLGWERGITEPDWVLLRHPSGGTGLSFQAEADYVPPVWPEEPGRQQKMLHLDIQVADLEATAAAAVAAGARLADHQPQDGVRVLLDPAGHPFCLFLD